MKSRNRITVEDILRNTDMEVKLRLRHILFVASVLLVLAWWIVDSASKSIGQ